LVPLKEGGTIPTKPNTWRVNTHQIPTKYPPTHQTEKALMANYEIHDLEMKTTDLERRIQAAEKLAEYAIERARRAEQELLDTWKQFREINQRLDRLENKGGRMSRNE
jgi:aspartyl/asparaginyl-tRNA synthetase